LHIAFPCFGAVRMPGLRQCGLALAMATLLSVGMAGCTSLPQDPDERLEQLETNDPLEPLNRHIFAVNQAIDVIILRPIAVVYRDVMPEFGKRVVHNFVTNLRLPFTTINDLLQGQWNRAGVAAKRFVVNSTVGVAGLFDVATDNGLPYHEEDFGQTLASWGIGEGPYLVLPLLGPSNFRDAIGLGVQLVSDPVNIAANVTDHDELLWARAGIEAVDSRYQLLGVLGDLEQQSLDYYAALRSLYRQRRADAIRNGNESDTDGLRPGIAAFRSPPADPAWDLRVRDGEDGPLLAAVPAAPQELTQDGAEMIRAAVNEAVGPALPMPRP